MSQKKLIKQKKSALRRELKDYRQQGVSLWLDGVISSPREIARACRLEEDGDTYMRDYVPDEKGEICEIHFDLIRNEQQN